MNTAKIPTDHLETIRRCLKKGDVLLPQIDEFDVDLLHAAVGIATEAGEMMEAILPMQLHKAFEAGNKVPGNTARKHVRPWDGFGGVPGVDADNIAEELGDHLFYEGVIRVTTLLENLEPEVGSVSADLWPLERGPLTLAVDATVGRKRTLVDLIMIHSVLAGQILDVAKRKVIYRKPFDTVYKEGEPTLRARLAQHLVDDCWVVSQIVSLLGRSEEAIREGNIMKLDKGKNARYKSGYSDQAASDRADKQEPPNQVVEVDADFARALLSGAPGHEAVGMTMGNLSSAEKVVFEVGVDEGFGVDEHVVVARTDEEVQKGVQDDLDRMENSIAGHGKSTDQTTEGDATPE